MMTLAIHEYHLNVHAAGKNYNLDFRQAFQFGYTLLRTRKFSDAAQVFGAMANSGIHDPSTAIMLAYCKTALRDYATSVSLLNTVFPEGQKDGPGQLHTAFVYMSVGMWADAIEELTALARQSPEIAAVYLLLGDLFALQHKRSKAILSWRLAVERDQDNGPVAAIARQLIGPQAKSHALQAKSEDS